MEVTVTAACAPDASEPNDDGAIVPAGTYRVVVTVTDVIAGTVEDSLDVVVEAPCSDDVLEDDDTTADATLLADGASQDLLCDDVDRFAVQAALSDTITATLTQDSATSPDLDITLYGTDGTNQLATTETQTADTETITFEATTSGTRYVAVTGAMAPWRPSPTPSCSLFAGRMGSSRTIPVSVRCLSCERGAGPRGDLPGRRGLLRPG
ncbi:MAG: hypothetical protein KY469_15215 [Actinobacteria bacterium]|nr:hypothetical protein [Actinomycetota bacterium]